MKKAIIKKEYLLLCKKSNGVFIKGGKYNSVFDGYRLYIELPDKNAFSIHLGLNDDNLKYIEEHFTTVHTHRKNIIDSIE